MSKSFLKVTNLRKNIVLLLWQFSSIILKVHTWSVVECFPMNPSSNEIAINILGPSLLLLSLAVTCSWSVLMKNQRSKGVPKYPIQLKVFTLMRVSKAFMKATKQGKTYSLLLWQFSSMI